MAVKKTYHIITIGCQMNKSDSERMAGYLEKHGYKKSAERGKAGLVVLVTCGVRQSAEDRIYGLVPKIKKENPRVKILLTGCLSRRKDVQRRLKNKVDIWLNIDELTELKKLLDSPPAFASAKGRGNDRGTFFCHSRESGNPESFLKNNYFKIIPKYSSKFSAFVPIGNGCNNFCSYCVVPYARGREVYRPANEIINEVKNLIKNGYKEIILIAQNVNSYKFQMSNVKCQTNVKCQMSNVKQKISFPKLLKMINDIKGDFWIRFFTSHPKDMSDELIKTIAASDKVCEHIHLPVQAGDNEILRAMNRNYTVSHYKSLIKKIRRGLPDASITTDIIVGFPGETKKQFNNTVKLFKEVKFDMAYISQYSPRPGTAAEKLKDNVSKVEKKKREEQLMKILRKTALANNKKYIGKVVDVLVERKNKRGEWYGKTETAKNVKLGIKNPSNSAGKQELGIRTIIGEFVKVKINKVRGFGLEGKIYSTGL